MSLRAPKAYRRQTAKEKNARDRGFIPAPSALALQQSAFATDFVQVIPVHEIKKKGRGEVITLPRKQAVIQIPHHTRSQIVCEPEIRPPTPSGSAIQPHPQSPAELPSVIDYIAELDVQHSEPDGLFVVTPPDDARRSQRQQKKTQSVDPMGAGSHP
jgi:hypothetical protein